MRNRFQGARHSKPPLFDMSGVHTDVKFQEMVVIKLMPWRIDSVSNFHHTANVVSEATVPR